MEMYMGNIYKKNICLQCVLAIKRRKSVILIEMSSNSSVDVEILFSRSLLGWYDPHTPTYLPCLLLDGPKVYIFLVVTCTFLNVLVLENMVWWCCKMTCVTNMSWVSSIVSCLLTLLFSLLLPMLIEVIFFYAFWNRSIARCFMAICLHPFYSDVHTIAIFSFQLCPQICLWHSFYKSNHQIFFNLWCTECGGTWIFNSFVREL